MHEAIAKGTEGWTTVIDGRSSWWRLNVMEIWAYRDLIWLFVKRDFVSYYKQTILGPLWFLIQPAISTIVFTVIFGRIAQISTDGLPEILFYMSGLVLWNYFAACLNKTAETFNSNAGIFGKVYFPRLSVPIAIVITNLLTFLIQFSFFLILLLYFYIKGSDVKPNLMILFLPFLLLQLAILGMGIGILVSSLTVRYRDLSFVVSFGVQLWMYVTPVVYPLSVVPHSWRWVFFINPMVTPIEFFRISFLGTGSIEILQVVTCWIVSVTIFLIGLIVFHRVEKNFMDTI